MKLQPIENKSAGPGWERSPHMAIANGHSDLEFTICSVCSVKVRRLVVAIENCDHDSEKAGDDGRVVTVERLRGRTL